MAVNIEQSSPVEASRVAVGGRFLICARYDEMKLQLGRN
jgi:hypothetical protein